MKINSSLSQSFVVLTTGAALLSLSACGSAQVPVEGTSSSSGGTSSSSSSNTVASSGSSTSSSSSSDDSSDTTSSTGGDDAESTTATPDYSLSIGTGVADANDILKSDEYSSSQSDKTLQCSAGYFMLGLEIEYTTWGLYPSITYIRMTCGHPDGQTERKTAGKFNNGSLFPVGCQGSVTSYGYAYEYEHGDFMRSLTVAHDNYVKDMKAGCSDLELTETPLSYTVNFTDPVYLMNYGSQVWGDYSRVQWDDTQRVIDCDGADEVLTGLNLSYKSDSNEVAYTKMQPICSQVKASKPNNLQINPGSFIYNGTIQFN